MSRVIDILGVAAGWLFVLMFTWGAVAAWWIPIPWLNALVALTMSALVLLLIGLMLEPTAKAIRPWGPPRGWK